MIKYKFLDELREKITHKNDTIAEKRNQWIRKNAYFYGQYLKTLKFIVGNDAKILHVHCGTGYILNELQPKYGVGIDHSSTQINIAKADYPNLSFYDQELEDIKLSKNSKFDFILISHIEDIVDLKAVLDGVQSYCYEHTRVIISYYNFLWEPLVKVAEKSRMKFPQNFHNWVSENDVNNFLALSDFEKVTTKRVILSPFNIPLISYILNKYIARLPFFRNFSMIRLTVGKPIDKRKKDYSVSVIIPCKDEAGNVEDAVKRIPKLGTKTEMIFCDDKSTDGTPDIVREMIKKYPKRNIRLVDGPGICKAENVWVGFDAAKHDIVLILDADLTVIPEELPYFYEAISKGYGEFINGSRLVYPMRDEAMRLFNVIGNKFFSVFFSYILDTEIKDTLCGTKVMWRKDYYRIRDLRGSWGTNDKWGDYELLFSAAKCNLKTIDLPVHYMERTYGETKMTNRVKNGLIMLRMCFAALSKIKFHY